MSMIIKPLEWVMNGCYALCNNYGWAIVLFTLISKIVLIPVSVWVQKNSIKMVKMQPEINFLKAKFFGDKDAIAEEQAKIFKREKYNPMASVIPLLIQIVLLMGVIEVIKAGMGNPAINMDFYGINLSLVPSEQGVGLIWSPIVAGVSAWILCVAQNAANVLQAEQSKSNKYGTMLFSVGLSLYLGWFVSIGVALYWVASNLMAVAQLYILNWAINPKKYVDYELLEKSKKELEELGNIGGQKKKKLFGDADSKRERADYKKFFSVANKRLVIYSEGSGYYKYFKNIVEYLLEHSNLIIHYVTNDPNDRIFEMAKEQTQIRPYYISEKKAITLMMKMDADMVLMSTPDLENYHLKRSYVRKDVEYIFTNHGIGSDNLTLRTHALDHFDTIFCVGPHIVEEERALEKLYNLPAKNLVETGYCLIDDMDENYAKMEKTENAVKTILVAPSWQQDNLMDSCLDELLDGILDKGYRVIVRPHPQYVRIYSAKMNRILEKYKDRFNDNFTIETDFSSNVTVYSADLLITDWSNIGYEFSFTTYKPTLYINTPMKVMNPEWQKIDVVPIDIRIRDQLGASIDLDKMDKVGEVVDKLIQNTVEYHGTIEQLKKETFYNLGHSGEVSGQYILKRLKEMQEQKKQAQQK